MVGNISKHFEIIHSFSKEILFFRPFLKLHKIKGSRVVGKKKRRMGNFSYARVKYGYLV